MDFKKNSSLLFLIISMSVFGTIGIFVKYIPLPSGFIAMSRGFIGALFLFLVMLVGGKKPDLGAIRKNLLLLITSGALIGFNWILLFEAYNYTSVATATLCYYAAPIFVIIVSPVFLREKITLKKLICVTISVIGMVMVSGTPASAGGKKEYIGIILGLGAAMLYASVIILNKKLRDISAYDKTSIQLLSAAVVLVPYTLLVEELSREAFSPLAVIMLLVVGIVHTGVAYAMYFGSMEGLRAQTVALFSYIDPVVAIILSAVILNENIGAWGYIGAALVLGSTFVSELPERKND